jgi:hypothetical protein
VSTGTSRWLSRCILIASLSTSLAMALGAQEPAVDPRAVQPERPTVATHAYTVAPGYVEVEAGMEGDRTGPGSRAWLAPTVTKVGLTSHVQLDLSTPAILGSSGQSGGFGDAAVGIKWRLLDRAALLGDVAIQPSVKFPTGSRATGTGSTDVGIIVISSHHLGSVSMDLNASWTRIGRRRATPASNAALWTASFGAPVERKLSWVAELFGEPTIDGSGRASTASLLTGPTYLVSPALNLDAGVIAPLRGDLPNAIYAGVVWNVGRLWNGGRSAVRRSTY